MIVNVRCIGQPQVHAHMKIFQSRTGFAFSVILYAFRHSLLALIMNGPTDAMLPYNKAPQESSDTDKKVDDTSGDKCSTCEIDPDASKKQICPEKKQKMEDMYRELRAVGSKDASEILEMIEDPTQLMKVMGDIEKLYQEKDKKTSSSTGS